MQSTSNQTNSNIHKQSQSSNQVLHSIVFVLIGVLALIALSYSFACWRVSQQERFGGLPVKTRILDQN